jgi:hypothetical protein
VGDLIWKGEDFAPTYIQAHQEIKTHVVLIENIYWLDQFYYYFIKMLML